MPIKTVPLSRLKTQLEQTLNECAASGETLVVELPDERLLAIHCIDPNDDDSLIDDLIESDPKFQALIEKSKAGRRSPFVPSKATDQKG